MLRYIKRTIGGGSDKYIYYWKSKGLFDESIKSIARSNYKINSLLSYYVTKTRVEFSGSCLKQGKAIFNHGIKVNIYIVYEISRNFNIISYPALGNCFFGAVSFTKHADIDQYKYSGYGSEFYWHGSFSFSNGLGRYVIIFRVDMSSSKKIDNRKKDVLILGKGFYTRIRAYTKCSKIVFN